MESLYVRKLAGFFLLAVFMFAVTGCGSSGSTASSPASSPASNETGSVAVKLVWSSGAKTTAKTLYAFPADVNSIKISVYYDTSSINTNNLITSQTFDPSLGSGTITGIPAGNGRAIKVEGLGPHGSSTGILTYLGTATVNVIAGPTPTPVAITMAAPVTTAFPASAPSAAGFEVTLSTAVPATIYYTTNEPATIYYTTNGSDPTIGNGLDLNTASPHGPSPVNNIWIEPGQIKLKFFSVVQGLYEAIQTITYR